MDLKQFEAAGWPALEAAAHDADARFRYLTLCSVDAAQRPQARTVVLRECDVTRRLLSFHTDVRSPKWQEMAANPQVTALGYCHQQRLQLRLAGSVSCYAAESDIARTAWCTLSAHTRQTYAGGPPGEILSHDSETAKTVSADAGRLNFGVIILQVSELDICQLQRNANQRARFCYGPTGELLTSAWRCP